MIDLKTILFFVVMLVFAFVLEPQSNKRNLPLPLILIVLGFVGSEIATGLFAIDTGIRWYHFQTIIFYGFIPILIFQTAHRINHVILRRQLFVVTVLGIPLMLLMVFLIASMLFYWIDHPAGFPWIAALLCAAILSATDPSALIPLLKKLHVNDSVIAVLEGESLFNDAIAILLFSLFMTVAVDMQSIPKSTELLFEFFKIVIGGVACGGTVAMITHGLIKLNDSNQSIIGLSLISAYTSYVLANSVLQVSGVLAVLSCSLLLHVQRSQTKPRDEMAVIDEFWNVLHAIAEKLLYILVGITVTYSMFVDQWLAILFGVIAVVLSRFMLVVPTLNALVLSGLVEKLDLKKQALIAWLGARGTVTLVLALSLPVSLDYYYTIQSITYGVVIFTFIMQIISLHCIIN